MRINLHVVSSWTQQSIKVQGPLYFENLDLLPLNLFSRKIPATVGYAVISGYKEIGIVHNVAVVV